MIEITETGILPDTVVEKVKTNNSGCALAYVGLIRDKSNGKEVVSVQYEDRTGTAAEGLEKIASEAKEKWGLNGIAITHRIGKLNVGDINLVVAVSAGHRGEAFAACQFVIDNFKSRLPTHKTETYTDGTVYIAEE